MLSNIPLPLPRSVADIDSAANVGHEVTDDPEELAYLHLTERFKTFSMHSVQNRYFGQGRLVQPHLLQSGIITNLTFFSTSMFAFAEQARIARRQHGDIPPQRFPGVVRPYFWNLRPVSGSNLSRMYYNRPSVHVLVGERVRRPPTTRVHLPRARPLGKPCSALLREGPYSVSCCPSPYLFA